MAGKQSFGARRQRNGDRNLRIACLLASTAWLAPSTVHSAGLFRDLANPASGYFWTDATGISGNGRYVVGHGYGPNGVQSFFYDTTSGVMRDMGQYLSGHATGAYDVSNNGVAVGMAIDSAIQYQAFRWTAADGYQLLGTLDGINTTGRGIAYAISNDGTRIVGWSARHDSIGQERAFVWIEGATSGVAGNAQMHELAGFAPDARSWASDISANGLFAVGESSPAGGSTMLSRATRWDLRDIEATGTAAAQDLGTLGGVTSAATGANGDGRVVVGWSFLDDDYTMAAFRWVEGGSEGVEGNPQMQDLGSFGGRITRASAVSADGNVVVGDSADASDAALAFRWTEETGMISVADWLAQSGVDVGSFVLRSATGVSDDGTTIVGGMRDSANPDDYSPYIARVSRLGTGVMDVNEYNKTLYDIGHVGSAGGMGTRLALNGAHHRPLMDYPQQGDLCGWANGDLAHYGDGRDASAGLAEVGFCGDLLDGAMRIGLGIGSSYSRQDLMNGGHSDLDGQYVIGELNWQPAGTPFLLSLTGVYGGWDADIRRGYSNGGSTSYSQGDTDVHSGAVRLRADWRDALTLGSVGFSPYLAYTWSHTAIDGYTETGGSFPASFDGQNAQRHEGRLGLTSQLALTEAVSLSGTMELVHSAGDASKSSGRVLGLHNFSFGGGKQGETWARIGADVDVKVSENALVSLSLHAATEGLDAQVSGAARFQIAF